MKYFKNKNFKLHLSMAHQTFYPQIVEICIDIKSL